MTTDLLTYYILILISTLSLQFAAAAARLSMALCWHTVVCSLSDCQQRLQPDRKVSVASMN